MNLEFSIIVGILVVFFLVYSIRAVADVSERGVKNVTSVVKKFPYTFTYGDEQDLDTLTLDFSGIVGDKYTNHQQISLTNFPVTYTFHLELKNIVYSLDDRRSLAVAADKNIRLRREKPFLYNNERVRVTFDGKNYNIPDDPGDSGIMKIGITQLNSYLIGLRDFAFLSLEFYGEGSGDFTIMVDSMTLNPDLFKYNIIINNNSSRGVVFGSSEKSTKIINTTQKNSKTFILEYSNSVKNFEVNIT